MSDSGSPRRILVSACLLGVRCNYNAKASGDFCQRPLFWESTFERFEVFPVCPEQLGGLPTPRIPAELCGSAAAVLSGNAKVVNKNGADVTGCFIKGGEETVRLARLVRADLAVLKSRSPSCGKNHVYDGTFTGNLVDGSGVTVQMLRDAGFLVMDEYEFFALCECTSPGLR